MLTAEETAERLQVSSSTVKRWLRNGELAGFKLGGKLWRVEEEELQKFIATSKNKTSDDAAHKAEKM